MFKFFSSEAGNTLGWSKVRLCAEVLNLGRSDLAATIQRTSSW